jgi:1-acyl-sn-glycerol-3-phosphate acyltransferase
LIFIAIAGSFWDRSGKFPHLIARIWAKSILFVSRIKVAVRGNSHIDPSKSYIFMSNHQSNFDIPVLLSHLKVHFRWLAKAELFKIPLFGAAMKRAGYISIDRTNRASAIKSINRAAEIIREGVSVIIFPEGTRSRDGHIRPFKKGGFVLAIDSGVAIVPVVLHGTRRIMPKGRLHILSGNVLVEIHEPIETSGYTRKDKDDLMNKVRNTICEAFERGKDRRP